MLMKSVYSCQGSADHPLGSLIAGPIINHYGSKTTLVYNNVLVLIGSALSGFAKMVGRFELMIVGRFIAGINGGMNSTIVPVYLTEISPISTRGYIGSGHQIGIGIGIAIAVVLGLKQIFGTEELFPLMFAFSALLAVFQLCSLPFCPESPRFLMLTRKDQEAAGKSLRWFRRTHDVSDDINEMKIELQHLERQKKFSVGDLIRNEDLRRPLVICIMLNIAQQCSGIVAAASYSTSVFHQVIKSLETSSYLALGLSVGGAVLCIVCTGLIEKSGRRKLFLFGIGGMAISLSFLTVCLVFQEKIKWLSYGSIIGVFAHTLFFNTGPASIPWFMVAEMFTQESKSSAMTIAIFFNSLSAFIVSLLFPVIQEFIKQYSFVPFASSLVLFFFYFYKKLPETKGRTIEEIADKFRSKKLFNDNSTINRSVSNKDSL
ncbi:hypothetical protein SNE40_011345 [Patella caerulea]|uniref:Major facilitator superfamily (MFS) profile domain-containing protein n=1 Tax=Patella caerulea TaxID=87958 RepID=A0AAN8JLF3_PATCE